MSVNQYVGEELDLFAHADNWKRYWSGQVAQFLGRSVLEVGAGIGASTTVFSTFAEAAAKSWLCLEPDPNLAKRIAEKIASGELPDYCTVSIGTVSEIAPEARFDSILYIDVLEHIENDREELALSAKLLHPGGTLIVLAPAHQGLYSPFDRSIGHFRRYNRRSLLELTPPGLTVSRSIYLDSVGLLASAANRFFLNKPMPSLKDILLWDRRMVPISMRLDPLIGYCLGKSVLTVWSLKTGSQM